MHLPAVCPKVRTVETAVLSFSELVIVCCSLIGQANIQGQSHLQYRPHINRQTDGQTDNKEISDGGLNI